MKMRHVVFAASAALLSFGVIAGAEEQAIRDATTVRAAQERLRAHGYAATPQGLKEFQQAKGMEPSGKLDAQTLTALGVKDRAK